MKDATGELSMTAVAVVAIAAIALVFRTLIWPAIQTSIEKSTYCSSAYGCHDCSESTCECYYTATGGTETAITCPNNGTGTYLEDGEGTPEG